MLAKRGKYTLIQLLPKKTFIKTLIGEEQKEWVRKYDIFTCKNLFKKYQRFDDLAEVEKIRTEVSDLLISDDLKSKN